MGLSFHRIGPSGPIRSTSRDVRLYVCLSRLDRFRSKYIIAEDNLVHYIEAFEKLSFLVFDCERKSDRTWSLVLSSLSKIMTVDYF